MDLAPLSGISSHFSEVCVLLSHKTNENDYVQIQIFVSCYSSLQKNNTDVSLLRDSMMSDDNIEC